jgi:hypothetical protein
MKRLIFMLCLSICILSCQKDDDVSPTNNSISSVNEFLRTQNGLRITELIEEGTNKTAQFSLYLFVFNENGTVTATQSSETINGTYLVFRDDNRTELRMTFPNNSLLFELSDDWYFISQNATTIRFEDNGDIVQFQKQ